MKKIFNFGLSIAVAFSMLSCEEESVDSLHYVNVPFVSLFFDHTHVFPNPPSVVKRKVLLEDFTGHKCGNCPGAARKITQLQETSPYKEQLIAIAVHGNGPFNAFTPGADQFSYNFSTPEGSALDADFGAAAAGLPKGTVNRDGGNGVQVYGKNQWQSVVDKFINEDPVAWVDVFGKIQPGDDKYIDISTRIKFLEDYPNPVNVNVVIVENKIINWQKDYSKTPENIENYEHNHVLRYNHESANLNLFGTWGRELDSHNSSTDIIKNISTSYKNTDWNVDNLVIIAYIYDATTREILQANEVHLEK